MIWFNRKLKERVEKLETQFQSLQQKQWELSNPPKYKVGDITSIPELGSYYSSNSKKLLIVKYLGVQSHEYDGGYFYSHKYLAYDKNNNQSISFSSR